MPCDHCRRLLLCLKQITGSLGKVLGANLVTNFKSEVTKVKHLVILLPMLGAISCPVLLMFLPLSWCSSWLLFDF